MRIKQIHLIFMLCLISVINYGCGKSTAKLEKYYGSTVINSDGGKSTTEFRGVKIVTATGDDLSAVNLIVGQSMVLKATIVDGEGRFISEAAVAWSFFLGSYPQTDLSCGSQLSIYCTFTPSQPGSVVIQIAAINVVPALSSATNVSSVLSVGTNGVANSLMLAAGNNQSAVVGSNLSNNLQVQVLDAYSLPIAGVQVNFSVTSGSGTILSSATPFSDANGFAAVSYRVGNSAGSNTIRAEVASNSSLFSTFSVNALPGSPDHLGFYVQPAGSYAAAQFLTQPRLRVYDLYNNLITGFAGSISLSVQIGGGSLFGTTVVAVSNGEAQFSGVGYTQVGAGVVIRASDGIRTVDSSPLNFAALPPGACQVNDSFFKTAEGGCKDLATNAIWSAQSASGMTWYDLIWDSFTAGAAAPEASDNGYTSDYDPENLAAIDTTGNSYCHSLVQGGYTDWRAPTSAELSQMYANQTTSGSDKLNNWNTTLSYWAASTVSSSTASFLNGFNGNMRTDGNPIWAYRVYCVRKIGGRSPATQLSIAQSPRAVGIGFNPIDSLIVQVRTAAGQVASIQGITLSLSTSLGSLSGASSQSTNAFGRVTLNNFQLDTVGDAVITISGGGYSPTSFTLSVGGFKHSCKIGSSRYTSLEGGCKDNITKFVWSARTPSSSNTWYEIIWDSVNPGFNTPPDAGDGGRTNDYDSGFADTVPDSDATNYCHELVEGGFSDWRTPTKAELQSLNNFGNGAGVFFGFNVNQNYWSSTTNWLDRAEYVNPASGAVSNQYKYVGSNLVGICVRQGI